MLSSKHLFLQLGNLSDQESYIKRDADIARIFKEMTVELRSGWFMIGNPRGYGKSSLVKEMAHTRDELSKRFEVPSGPVLLTDFRDVESPSDARRRVMETIQPLFFGTYVPLFDGRGMFFCIFAFFVYIVYIFFVYVFLFVSLQAS